jgi:DNA primase
VKLSAAQRNSLEAAAKNYYGSVAKIKDYLEGRGLDGETCAMYRLGYVENPERGHEQFRGRLAIPYLTPAGVVDIRFRRVDDHNGPRSEGPPKYLGLDGIKTGMFGVLAVQHATGDTIAITEGEIDAIVLTAKCGIPAVGVPGAQGWKPHYGRCLQDFDNVLVFCDGDKPGREFGKAVAREIRGATTIHLPDGEDVNSIYLSEGADYLRKKAGL